jgi:hypothetical protein
MQYAAHAKKKIIQMKLVQVATFLAYSLEVEFVCIFSINTKLTYVEKIPLPTLVYFSSFFFSLNAFIVSNKSEFNRLPTSTDHFL